MWPDASLANRRFLKNLALHSIIGCSDKIYQPALFRHNIQPKVDTTQNNTQTTNFNKTYSRFGHSSVGSTTDG